ncbi:MAG: enoyl-CoA hydratase-related protein [Burkholderiales bacterium]
MRTQAIKVSLASAVAVIWLSRPDSQNALDFAMVNSLEATLRELQADNSIRAIVLAGEGEVFSTGIDAHLLHQMSKASKAALDKHILATMQLFRTLDEIGKPTLARVHGAARSVALGVIAACDIAVAAIDAEFSIDETRLGFISAGMLPYLVRAMGARYARRYLLSGESFTAADAYRIGLVHELAPPQELDARINEILGQLLLAAPKAASMTKKVIAELALSPTTNAKNSILAQRTASLMGANEAKAGVEAFLKENAPSWAIQSGRKPSRRTRGN